MSDEQYARDITQQIQEDITRQTAVDEAIIRDENRLRAIEAELNNIRKRMEENKNYKKHLEVYLPLRIRSHKLLCADLGIDAPVFNQARPASRAMDSRPISDDTLERLTGTKQLPPLKQSIGDQLRAERERPLDVSPDTVEWLEGKQE